MDPLSDVLSLLKPATYAFRGLDAGGDWIHSGACWLALQGAPAPVRLVAGDVVLLPTGTAFCLYSAPGALPIDPETFFTAFAPGQIAVLNGGGGCSGVGGYFDFEGARADLLLRMLPPIVHIRAEATKAALLGSIERLMGELREPRPGGSLIAGHVAQMILIEALRLHLAERSHDSIGWLFALADRQMSAAIAAMHREPGCKWTLQALAREAGMSRSSFAARFKATVGEPAMDYLTRWRMLLAADRLARGDAPIAIVAPSVGYDSESAFGAAFKRIIGHPPRRFARRAAT
jgi:AraC-like DNA-binding protein